MKTYQVICSPASPSWWGVRIPELDGVTQAESRDSVEQMAREWIALTLDCEVTDFSIEVTERITPTLKATRASAEGN